MSETREGGVEIGVLQTNIRFSGRRKFLLAHLMPPEGEQGKPILLRDLYLKCIDALWVQMMQRRFNAVHSHTEQTERAP